MSQLNPYITLNEVITAKQELRSAVPKGLWRAILFTVVWGTGAAVFFVMTTWLTSLFDPIKSTSTYWIVGTFSFLFFGSWPIIDFVRTFLFHQRHLTAIENRIRAGENVPRPNKPLNLSTPVKSATRNE
jgi:hypothetical protein